ncbi:MAG: hypothetical protein J0G32_06790 [Alphaproteobacteria bacterium]|nr:hypothetical protein [Alphaproteobacteria bacterium]OJV12098.1 MAG: hypothetical protein BGO27_05095 [Alphaproteobacteria bacterium 33-17]
MYQTLIDLINDNKIDEATKLYQSLTMQQKCQVIDDIAKNKNHSLALFIKKTIEQTVFKNEDEENYVLRSYASYFLNEGAKNESDNISFLCNNIISNNVIKHIKKLCIESEKIYSNATNLYNAQSQIFNNLNDLEHHVVNDDNKDEIASKIEQLQKSQNNLKKIIDQHYKMGHFVQKGMAVGWLIPKTSYMHNMLKAENPALLKLIWDKFTPQEMDYIVESLYKNNELITYFIPESTLEWFFNALPSQKQDFLIQESLYNPAIEECFEKELLTWTKTYFKNKELSEQIAEIENSEFQEFLNFEDIDKLKILIHAQSLKKHDFIYSCLNTYKLDCEANDSLNEFKDLYLHFFLHLCEQSTTQHSLVTAKLIYDLFDDKEFLFKNTQELKYYIKNLSERSDFKDLEINSNILALAQIDETSYQTSAYIKFKFVKWLWSVIPEDLKHIIFEDNNFDVFAYSLGNQFLRKFWWSLCNNAQKEEIITLIISADENGNKIISYCFLRFCWENEYEIAKEIWDIAFSKYGANFNNNEAQLLAALIIEEENEIYFKEIADCPFNMMNFLLSKDPTNPEIIDSINNARSDRSKFATYEEFYNSQEAIFGEEVSTLIWNCYKAGYSIPQAEYIIKTFASDVSKFKKVADLVSICKMLGYSFNQTAYLFNTFGGEIATLVIDLHAEGFDINRVLQTTSQYQYTLNMYHQHHSQDITFEALQEIIANSKKVVAALTEYDSHLRKLDRDAMGEILKFLDIHPNDFFRDIKCTRNTVQDVESSITKKRKFTEIEEEKQSSNKKQNTGNSID